MSPLEKLIYLGPRQTARKYLLKLEQAAKHGKKSPPLPEQDPSIDLQFHFLGHDFDLRAPNRWHRSPDTGAAWPMAYAPTMKVTGPEASGDVKLVWELNRHQFLPALADANPALVAIIIRDWIAQNPCEFGVNWNSAMEVGLRMISWLETFEKLPQLREKFSASLAQHARFIRHHLSADWIPRGNHLIGEAAALAVYGHEHAAFARRWLAQAAREQFHASGVHREQSVAYHHFVTHLFVIAGLPQAKAMSYLAAIRQPDGSLPMVGDSDDGLASTKRLELPAAPATSVAFADAGHYVIRHGGDYCFIRCGEFGLSPNCAHSHADLLSPVLWLQGEPVFVDAGTFTYNGNAELRRHFRSAKAHNVVTVNDQDTAEQNGTFSWKNVPQGVCESWTEHEFVGRVGMWLRRIRYVSGKFTITDSAPAGRLRWRFHLHPNLKVTRCADGEFLFGKFLLTTPGKLSVGKGWMSTAYNRRVPVDTCEVALETSSPVTVEFALQSSRAGSTTKANC